MVSCDVPDICTWILPKNPRNTENNLKDKRPDSLIVQWWCTSFHRNNQGSISCPSADGEGLGSGWVCVSIYQSKKTKKIDQAHCIWSQYSMLHSSYAKSLNRWPTWAFFIFNICSSSTTLTMLTSKEIFSLVDKSTQWKHFAVRE